MTNTRKAARRATRIALAAALALASGFALADTRFEERLDLSPGGTFVLDTDTGSIAIRGGSDSGVVVTVTSDRDDVRDRLKFEFASDGSTATVKVRKPASERGFFGWMKSAASERVRFEVVVPSTAHVVADTAGGSIDVEDVRGRVEADTSGGGIAIRRIAGDVAADTSGGSIDVEDIDGSAVLDTSGGGIVARGVTGDVDADTSGGSIELVGIGGQARADTSGGSIRIEDAAGRIQADTSGGSIVATFAAGNGAGGTLETSGGRIEVVVDPGVGLDIDAEATSGVRTDLPITVEGRVEKDRVRGKINGGGATLRLRASGGSIRIQPR